MTVTRGTDLVYMYAQSGDMNKAMKTFWWVKDKNFCTWSIAMNGLATNDADVRYLELFALMKQNRVLPNGVTFINFYWMSSVVGLVEEGFQHFDSM